GDGEEDDVAEPGGAVDRGCVDVRAEAFDLPGQGLGSAGVAEGDPMPRPGEEPGEGPADLPGADHADLHPARSVFEFSSFRVALEVRCRARRHADRADRSWSVERRDPADGPTPGR